LDLLQRSTRRRSGWSRYLDGIAKDISVNSDGSLLIARSDPQIPDGFVDKLDPNGALLWSRNVITGSISGIALTPSDDIIVTGSTNSSDLPGAVNFFHVDPAFGYPTTDAFLAKLDDDGSVMWSQYIGGTRDDAGADVEVDSSGHAIVVGQTVSTDGDLENALGGDITSGVTGASLQR